jgi:hypothetical protein
VMIFLPEGLDGLITNLVRRFRGGKNEEAEA